RPEKKPTRNKDEYNNMNITSSTTPENEHLFTTPEASSATQELDKRFQLNRILSHYDPREYDLGLNQKAGEKNTMERFYKFSPGDRDEIVQLFEKNKAALQKSNEWISKIFKQCKTLEEIKSHFEKINRFASLKHNNKNYTQIKGNY
ncbi:MAG TPA: hypothetical protein VKO61_01900, partial [Candidatus Paceibacterota bacterium]|nr:hypothetical protein [Candidatus Paceibacterota bacterium]